jgi:importin subunit alpha-1
VEQAIWAVGNIASDSVYHRNSLIASEGVENLVRVIQANMMQENIVKHGAWALSNLCRGTPLPKYENVKLAIPLLCYLIAEDKINDK